VAEQLALIDDLVDDLSRAADEQRLLRPASASWSAREIWRII
jgi:hypothetical protein